MEKEIIIINEKIDKLQNHFTVYKTDIADLKQTVTGLTSAIVGNQYNGNKGIIYYAEMLSKRIEKIEIDQLHFEDDKRNIKYAAGVGFSALVAGFVSFIVWVFTK